MDELDKLIERLVKKDSFESTCKHCTFWPGNGNFSDACLAPWSDLHFGPHGDIDPCYEGVYCYLTGQPGPALEKLLRTRPDVVWLRLRGQEKAVNASTLPRWKEG